MTDAILFSAKPSMVDMDDAIGHLTSHKELYWSVGFPVSKAAKESMSFPIFGFIHVSGDQVRYRALVADIFPFSATHYEDASLKPEQWRDDWKNKVEARMHPWKHALVMTEIVPFDFDTLKFEKYGGGLVSHAPEGYVRVIPPNEPSATSPGMPSPLSIYEKNLEDLVVQQLDAIEAGLTLVQRQMPTPAGRLDLLCKDAHGDYVVIELKRGRGSDQVVGQALRYVAWAREAYPTSKVRGIVIVGKIDNELRYAINAVPGVLQAKEFKLSIA